MAKAIIEHRLAEEARAAGDEEALLVYLADLRSAIKSIIWVNCKIHATPPQELIADFCHPADLKAERRNSSPPADLMAELHYSPPPADLMAELCSANLCGPSGFQ